jgi:tRNA (uracil-5-)-methyltransferase TRM9
MKPEIRTALLELNRAFYTRFAGEFARTRRTWPPGFDRILPHLRPAARVLDLGCGNGRLLSFLAERGWRGEYAGIDASRELLAEAFAAGEAATGIPACFAQADLLSLGWVEVVDLECTSRAGAPAEAGAAEALLPYSKSRWPTIACLAVLHHMPGAEQRARFLSEAATLLAPGGRLIVSTWQFMTSDRLRGRVLPWETSGLRAEDMEPGDYLVAWGEGAAGRRYCAFIDAVTLDDLAAQAGLVRVDAFYADGHEGNLNLYGVYEKLSPGKPELVA